MGKGPWLLSSYSATSSDPFKWPCGLDSEYDLRSCTHTFSRRYSHMVFVGIKEIGKKVGKSEIQKEETNKQTNKGDRHEVEQELAKIFYDNG